MFFLLLITVMKLEITSFDLFLARCFENVFQMLKHVFGEMSQAFCK